MLSISLAISLILQPLQPLISTTDPALTIHLGDHLPDIVADKSPDMPPTILLSVGDWLRIKDIIMFSPDLCNSAVETAAQTCAQEALRVAESVKARSTKDAELIASLQRSLTIQKELTASEERRAHQLKWATISVSAVAVMLTTILVIK